MADLTHWDFQETFSPIEVCCLILGTDPAATRRYDEREAVIFSRMEADFERARSALWISVSGFPFEGERWPARGGLVSVEMERKSRLGEDKWSAAEDWANRAEGNFEHESLSRAAIHEWLEANGLPSEYTFAPKQKSSAPPAIEGRPLAKRERETLLTIIAALAKEAKIPLAAPSKAATLIQDLTDQLGAPVSKRAIEDHLKNIPAAIAARSR
ncbi:hypothetical protein WKW79_14565 [Variovorax robiniae]|uniref:Uncharacterized protein n=1 Tax=Variovorax robiniae TaxID=1836199 RepID=A0ABU8X9R2_9BURK